MLRAITRSRAFTPGFKFFSGVTVFALLMAFFLALGTNGKEFTSDPISIVLGPTTLGWKGFVGNHFTYVFFVGLAMAGAFLAGLLVAFRDADPEAQAQVAETESVPLTRAPAGSNYWPLAGAAGTALVAAGMATNRWITYAGFFLLGATAIVWTLRAWSERATGDDEVNRDLYHRVVDPLRVPVLSALIVGLFAIGISRLMLVVSKEAAVAVFGLTALVFFVVLILIAMYPKQTRPIITALAVIALAFTVFCFVLYGIKGERDFTEHGSSSPSTAVTGGSGGAGGGATASGGAQEGSMAPTGAGRLSEDGVSGQA